MNESFSTYYYEYIICPYFDYYNTKNNESYGGSKDIKKGINSAVALYHLREHLPLDCKISFDYIKNKCPEYLIIKDIVNISKHKQINRDNPQIIDFNQIKEYLVITEYKDKEGIYINHDKIILIKLTNGKETTLHEILYKVMSFRTNILHEKGCIADKREIPIYKEIYPKKRNECSLCKLNITQGLGKNIPLKFQKYDYIKKRIIPIDLTGKTVSFNVYK